MTRLFRYAWTMRRFLPAASTRRLAPIPVISCRVRVVLLSILVSLVTSACGGERDGPPDLVLITVDTLAADGLGCFGGQRDQGKSICQLAHGGTRFGWSMVPGRGIASTMASVLTGLVPTAHGVDDAGVRFLADAHLTLAEELAKAGYATAAFVEDPLLNQTRRLDQGFELYAAALESDRPRSDLPDRVEAWIERAAAARPFFVWIHLSPPRAPRPVSGTDSRGESPGPNEAKPGTPGGGAQWAEIARVDRALARLESALTDPSDRSADGRAPGVLFAALRGDATAPDKIELASHRVPMIWRRAAESSAVLPPNEVFALTSLLDIHPTLRAAARLEPREANETSGVDSISQPGMPLDSADAARAEERFLLLRASGPDGDVGIASGRHVYVRAPSELDVAGSPVPSELLEKHAARFLTRSTAATWSSLGTMLWRSDVLSSDSPVPRLEFHLTRLLGARADSALGENP